MTQSAGVREVAALHQQVDLLATELAVTKAALQRCSTTRSNLRRDLTKARMIAAKAVKRAEFAGVDLGGIKLPAPVRPQPYKRRRLPMSMGGPISKRKRAALRAGYKRRMANTRAKERARVRGERERVRMETAGKRKRALTGVRRVLPATCAGLKVLNHYIPESIMISVKYAAIERDQFLALLNASIDTDADWPVDVLPIKGASGVVAQVLSDWFAEQQAMRDGVRERERGMEMERAYEASGEMREEL